MAAAPTNLALNKPAYLSSMLVLDAYGWSGPGPYAFLAAYCVDGKPDTFCHSYDGDQQPVLAVDLGVLSLVTRIVIRNRINCCGDKLRDAQLRIGDAAYTGMGSNGNISTNPLVWTQPPDTAHTGQVWDFPVAPPVLGRS